MTPDVLRDVVKRARMIEQAYGVRIRAGLSLEGFTFQVIDRGKEINAVLGYEELDQAKEPLSLVQDFLLQRVRQLSGWREPV